MNQIKMGAVLSYASLLITIGITLFYTPILVKNLGQVEYGVYSLMAAFVGYLTVLDMGLGNAIVRYVARTRANNDRKQEAKLSGMFLILFTLLGVLVTLVGMVMYYQIDLLFDNTLASEELVLAKMIAIILVANFALSFPLSVFGAIVQAHERFIFLKMTNIIRTVITPLVIVPMLFLGHGSVMIVTITSILNIIFLLLNVWYCFKKLNVKIKFEKFDKALLKEILIYSSFIFLNAIMDKIYWSTDQIIIGAVNGANQVAVYAIAMQFIMVYMSIATAISGLFLPKVSIMEINGASDKEFSDLFIKIGKIQAILIYYVVGIFFLVGSEFIYLWIGKEYANAFYIVVIILTPLSIIWTQTIGIPILQAKNKHVFRSVIYLIVSIVNIIVSIPVAEKYGEIGVAIVTALCLLVSHIFFMNIYYWKKIHLDIFSFWKSISKNIAITIISVGCLYYLKVKVIADISWTILIFYGVIYSVIYFVSIYFFDLDNTKREQIQIYLKRRFT